MRIFQTIVVSYGQTLQLGRKITQEFLPRSLEKSHTTLQLLASKKTDEFPWLYRNDDSIHKVGDLSIPVPPNARLFKDPSVVVEFEFGGPVIVARGYFKEAKDQMLEVTLILDDLEQDVDEE